MRGKLFATALGFLGMISDARGTIITFERESGLYITTNEFNFDDSGYEFVFSTGGQPGGGSGPAALIGEPNANIICSPPCSSDGTSAYYSLNGATLTVLNIDNLPFSLDSLDAAQVFTTLNFSLDLSVVGRIEGGGAVTAVLATGPGGADTFADYSFPSSFIDLSSVQFVGGEGYPADEFAIDNITIYSVPEPSTLAMLLLGVAGLGVVAYRRNGS